MFFRIIRFRKTDKHIYPLLHWKDYNDRYIADNVFKALKENQSVVCAYLLYIDNEKVYELDSFIKE